MRLIYVTVSTPFGSGEEFFIPEVKEWMRRGDEVLIVPRSPRGPIVNEDARCLQQASVRRHLWSLGVLACAGGQALRHPVRFLKVLRLLVASRGPKTLLKNFTVLPKGLWLGRLANRWGADHIHAHWATTTATMGMIASEWSGIPWSFTAHSIDIVMANLLGLKTAKATFTRYISEVGRGVAGKRGAQVQPGRAVVIPMGVAVPAECAAVCPDRNPAVAVCPASLLPVKGHEHLLRAMARLKDEGVPCTLRLAGEGSLRGKLERLAEALSLGPTVQFLGQVPHERLLDWYRQGQIDLVVLPSLDLGNHEHEGVPVSLMEAMAYGIPVVSTATGGIPELLDGGAGMMVPPQDPAALAGAIKRLVGDVALREQLGAAGRRRIEEQFSVERTVDALAARIEAATGRVSQPSGPLRVLSVIPAGAVESAMIFAKRQSASLEACGIVVQPFFLAGRPHWFHVLLREWVRLRRAIDAFRPDLVHAHFGGLTGFMCLLAARTPLVVTYGGNDINPYPSPRWLVTWLLSQCTALKADRIICVSEQLNRRLWFGKSRADVIPRGVDTSIFSASPPGEARTRLGWDPAERIVLFNNNEPRIKRLDLAEAAVDVARKACADIRLMVLDGTVPPERMPEVLNASDCLLVTSDSEGSPNIVKEAIACGLPVVSVDVGDVRERLGGIEPSRVVARDPEVIGKALADVLREGRRSNGPERVADISLSSVARRVLSVYEAAARS